jgi:sporadic carbohydrate cluster protein (TIGR04323 family)
MNQARGYIFSRPFMGERVPQHVQNLVIRDYCEKKGLNFLLSATEYAMPGCHLILEQILGELSDLEGIVLYSLFQLPENSARRQIIYHQIVKQAKILHFAVEGLHACTKQAFDRVETLWRVRLTMSQ